MESELKWVLIPWTKWVSSLEALSWAIKFSISTTGRRDILLSKIECDTRSLTFRRHDHQLQEMMAFHHLSYLHHNHFRKPKISCSHPRQQRDCLIQRFQKLNFILNLCSQNTHPLALRWECKYFQNCHRNHSCHSAVMLSDHLIICLIQIFIGARLQQHYLRK